MCWDLSDDHGRHDSGTLWLFNVAMENGPFIVHVPIKTSIYRGFSMAMLNNQMVRRKKHESFAKVQWRSENVMHALGF